MTDEKKLFTLSEICNHQENFPILNTTFTIKTENGERPAYLTNPKRQDLCLTANIGQPVCQHMVIDPLKTRVFISQTTLPSHQTPDT